MSTFVGQLMSSPVETVQRDVLAVDAAQKFIDKNIGSLIVVDDEGRFHGIVTATDILALVADKESPQETTIDEYVTTDVVTATTDTPLRDAADLLLENNIHHLPVLSSDKTVSGILSTANVAEYLSNTRKSDY